MIKRYPTNFFKKLWTIKFKPFHFKIRKSLNSEIQGVLFRMEFDVAGLMMICETCKWNYADKNAIYKHRHLNTCVSNIRITKEQKEKYETDAAKRPLSDLRAEIDFTILKNLQKPDLGPSMPFSIAHSLNKSDLPENTNGEHVGVSIKIGKEAFDVPSCKIEEISTEDSKDDQPVGFAGLESLTSAGLENLTPQQAADILRIIKGQVETNQIAEPEDVPEDSHEFNKCPAWGCKRKFTAFTHGGKSNISSLWIHMQNAHRNAFVVFRRIKRPGFDKYCEKCQFWLKGRHSTLS